MKLELVLSVIFSVAALIISIISLRTSRRSLRLHQHPDLQCYAFRLGDHATSVHLRIQNVGPVPAEDVRVVLRELHWRDDAIVQEHSETDLGGTSFHVAELAANADATHAFKLGPKNFPLPVVVLRFSITFHRKTDGKPYSKLCQYLVKNDKIYTPDEFPNPRWLTRIDRAVRRYLDSGPVKKAGPLGLSR